MLSTQLHSVKGMNPLAGFEGATRSSSRHAALLSQFAPLPDNCTRVAFDIGFNTGADTKFLLEQGFCVIGVDANPGMLKTARETNRKHSERVRLLNVGIDERPGNLSFYVTKFEGSVHSSFELAKVIRHSRARSERHKSYRTNWEATPKAATTGVGAAVASKTRKGGGAQQKSFTAFYRTIRVPTIRCEGLWSLLPGQERERRDSGGGRGGRGGGGRSGGGGGGGGGGGTRIERGLRANGNWASAAARNLPATAAEQRRQLNEDAGGAAGAMPAAAAAAGVAAIGGGGGDAEVADELDRLSAGSLPLEAYPGGAAGDSWQQQQQAGGGSSRGSSSIVAPSYVKIDIEERHFVCVEALRHVPRSLLPRFVSWEMHEHARGLPYPMLDAHLIGMMYDLGYSDMKVKSNRLEARGGSARVAGRNSGGTLPDAVRDAVTRNSSWVPVPAVLSRGLGSPRLTDDWFDFYMRRSDKAMARDGAMRARDGDGEAAMASPEAIVGR